MACLLIMRLPYFDQEKENLAYKFLKLTYKKRKAIRGPFPNIAYKLMKAM